MPRTLKLTIAYDGTNYAGWQRQANAISIQQILEEEIDAIVGTHNPLNAAGRTDAGVHAAAQIASITIDHAIPADELLRALNARLKAGDIRIRSIEEMPDRWDARIYSKGKTYRYAIWNGAPPSPFLRHVVWHVPQPLDADRMARAAGALIGEHDFVAFKGRGSDVRTTIRRVWSAELVETNIHTDQPVALSPLPSTTLGTGAIRPDDNSRLFRLEISGSGFLRHMVRTIAGTLVDIGRGNMAVDDMREIIESKDRSQTGQTAPAQGLMLWKVHY